MRERKPIAKAAFVASLFVVLACNGTDIAPPADSNGYETECDTVTPPMTSGGTYGPGWQVAGGETAAILEDIGGADDSGGPEFDVLPPTVVPDDDPTQWEYEPSEDSYYRSPTALELVDNDWLVPEDLLVVPPRPVLQALSAGSGSMDLPIPMFDEFGGRPQKSLEFRELTLGRTGTKSDVPFIEQRWEDSCLRRSTLEVSFSFYESRNFDPAAIDSSSIVGSAISSPERDSLAVRGATKDLSFSLRGPYLPARVQLELALPSNETAFYILKTQFDPAPGQLLVGSGGGVPLLRDDSRSSLTTHSSTAAVPQSCFDGVENNAETDIDCGGGECPVCDVGDDCLQASDCISRFCLTNKGNLPGVCTSQCTDGLDNDGDGVADSCDFNCVEHPDFRTDSIVHQVPLENATTIGQFGTMHYCTINEQSYLASFVEWASIGTFILNNVIPDDEAVEYDDSDRPPPFQVTMRGCVIADTTTIAEACDVQTSACPTHPGYPLDTISTGNWGSASTAGLGQATGVLGRVWQLVDYTVEHGVVTDTNPIQIAIVYPQQRDLNQAENGVAVSYRGPGTPATAGAVVSYWNNTFAGFNFAHEVGHTIGLSHEDALGEGSIYPGTVLRSFMSAPTAGPAPVLDENAASRVPGSTQWQTWLNSSSKEVPRAAGFSFLGCNNDDSVCQNGHPGLLCDEDTQTCR